MVVVLVLDLASTGPSRPTGSNTTTPVKTLSFISTNKNNLNNIEKKDAAKTSRNLSKHSTKLSSAAPNGKRNAATQRPHQDRRQTQNPLLRRLPRRNVKRRKNLAGLPKPANVPRFANAQKRVTAVPPTQTRKKIIQNKNASPRNILLTSPLCR